MSDVLIERVSGTDLAEMFGNEKKCEAFWNYSDSPPTERFPCPNAAEFLVTRACCGRRRVVCAECADGPFNCLGCGARDSYNATFRKV
ncbi:hypothetical protein SEA_ENGINEER_141 [Gordonia Phage Engineer]|nr:hypothetical protein SEA_ENGINEER_141 [Gordonia Phage Engineer]